MVDKTLTKSSKVKKCGGSFCILIRKEEADIYGFKEDDVVEVSIKKNGED